MKSKVTKGGKVKLTMSKQEAKTLKDVAMCTQLSTFTNSRFNNPQACDKVMARVFYGLVATVNKEGFLLA